MFYLTCHAYISLREFFPTCCENCILFQHWIHQTMFCYLLCIIHFIKFSSFLVQSKCSRQMTHEWLSDTVRSLGTNFTATQCISNFIVRISWHELVNMLHSSAISWAVKWWLEHAHTSPIWASLDDVEGKCGLSLLT